MRGDPMPQGLDFAEQILYQGLALLYERYHLGHMDKETARKEKWALIESYERIRFDAQLWASHRTMWTEVAGVMADYRKNKTIENADRCFDTLYGLKQS